MSGWTYSRWHCWFAWHPVRTIDLRWTWLVTVDRRRCYGPGWYSGETIAYWDYRHRDGIYPMAAHV